VFRLKGVRATVLLEAWLAWARRCRIPAFVRLARAITEHRAAIQAALTHGLSNGLVESVNTKIRLLTRVAFGFKSSDALIALAVLSLGGLCPPLPQRPQMTHGSVRRALIWNGLSRPRFAWWMAWFAGSGQVALERVIGAG
jgi:hypothetical protein